MARKVTTTKWYTADGAAFDFERDALLHERKLTIKKLIGQCTAQGELCEDEFIDLLFDRFELTRKQPKDAKVCQSCLGTGLNDEGYTCDTCHGLMVVPSDEWALSNHHTN